VTGGLTQSEVVHYVVGVVVIDLSIQALEKIAQIVLAEFQAHVIAGKLGAIHAAVRVGSLTIATRKRQLHAGVIIRRPGQNSLGIPAVVFRVNSIAITI